MSKYFRGGFSNNSIPERWESYKSMGRQIPGTRFIAFKVPLRETIMQKVRHAEWFCPRTLMDHCVNLGLVVDLTNTSRYYDPQVFISQGIEYAKLFTEGKIIPRNNNVYKFFNVVNNFLKQNKDNEKLIGVHCTHGLNRTGYMICRYMIQQLRIPSDQAIADYNSARGHAQERENYLADLRKAEWINEAIPVVSVDVQKGSAITTINPFTSNSPDGTSTSIRRPSLDKYLNYYGKNGDGSPSSKVPVRRWSHSPGNQGGREGWAPWKGASPRQVSSQPPKQQEGLSPYGARQYYDQRYHGRVAPQYDPYFYQEQGSGIGPHRAASRWAQTYNQKQSGPHGQPRQYRGPRPYRSPPRNEEPVAEFEESTEPLARTPTGCKLHHSLPRTPYWPPDGPRRHPLSPGARDEVFSPVVSRRHSARWNPY